MKSICDVVLISSQATTVRRSMTHVRKAPVTSTRAAQTGQPRSRVTVT